jgi:hypothetical protein
MTMPTDPMAQSNTFAAAATDAFKEATQINARLLERAAQHQMELLNASVEAGTRGAQLMHNPEAMREVASRYTERVLETLRRSMEAFTEAQKGLMAIQATFQQTAAGAVGQSAGSAGRKK